jgi:hypothetical protein
MNRRVKLHSEEMEVMKEEMEGDERRKCMDA